MYIKQVIIRGFKTYKDQVSLADDLDPGVNVVVGFNGSGKSNFFNAILFVISDYFGTLRAETRKALLHEGAGPAVLTAFVELVFDNKQRRMPIDKDEVRVRRTIAAKKDDYMLDGRHATKVEVFNLLESCGFAKSNPYYIVQQGRISELTLMNDARRLELMKEISGAAVFDERRVESQKILDEMAIREAGIDKVIETIREKIRSLEEEQKELLQFQKLEHKRRCLEFELTDRDWRSAQDRIVALERERQEVSLNLNETQREALLVRDELAVLEADLEQLINQRQRMAVEREERERQKAHRSDELAKRQLQLEDEKQRTTAGDQHLKQIKTELQNVEAELLSTNAEIEQIVPTLKSKHEERQRVAQRMQLDEARRDQLLAKQRRFSAYSSIGERNAALQSEIRRHEGRQDKYRQMLSSCQNELRNAQSRKEGATAKMAAARETIQQVQVELDREIASSLSTLTRKLEDCSERKRATLQELDKQERQNTELEREAQQLRGRLESGMPRQQRNALAAIMQWVEKEGLQQSVHGTLLDNIEVPPEFHIAAESTAGVSLFNLLVTDDAIAAKIITKVRTENLGSIVCTPLNRLAQAGSRGFSYPTISGVKPLVQVVKCTEVAKRAVEQIFGRTLVCSSLELSDEVSRKYGFDTITADGDKVSSKGTLSGGYQDPARFTRIKTSMKIRAGKKQRAELSLSLQSMKSRASAESEELALLHAERNVLQDRRSKRRGDLNLAVAELHDCERHLKRYEEEATRQQERIAEANNCLQECSTTIGGLRQEMSSGVLAQLSGNEQQELRNLTIACKGMSERHANLEQECYDLESSLKDKQALASGVLGKRKIQLESELLLARQGDLEEHLEEHQRSVKQLTSDHAQIVEAYDKLTASLSELDAQIDRKRVGKEGLSLRDNQLQTAISERDAELDDLVTRINALAKKKHEADEKMRTMTFVSTDVAQYKSLSGSQLLEQLRQTTAELSKFEHVNKKAIDQFATFTGQLEDLESSQQKQHESRREILKFVKQVEEQKEETMKKTLESVDHHFRAIFSELVDGGVGKLHLVKAEVGEEDEEGAAGLAKGVRVEVSFTGQNISFLTMNQLSGGQKTIVAISLIFAIQRLEPAPFYLFDEIDAALDTQYRTAVARLIERNAANAQMIITTFRPEIIDRASKFYRVYQQNRVSAIDCVSKQEARSVVEEQLRQEIVDG